jgi:hypothetical protein
MCTRAHVCVYARARGGGVLFSALRRPAHFCRRPVSQILESSQTLLHVLKRESVNLAKKKQTSS